MGAEEPVRYNRILAMLLNCAGVVDCTAMTVNGGTVNVRWTPRRCPPWGRSPSPRGKAVIPWQTYRH